MQPSPEAGRFAFLDEIKDLPSLPQVLVRISKVASEANANASELASVILKDQAMTLKVLRIANSARYSLHAQRVTTISRAIFLLGFESVRAIAVGLGAFHLLSALERGGKLLENFWREAVTTAVVCQELAELLAYGVSEEAFVAGLLHDVGKLILAQHSSAQAGILYASSLTGPALLATEKQYFGVDHTEVAAELGRRWELPEVLQKAMALHHRQYAGPPQERGELLAFAIGVAKSVPLPLPKEPEDVRELAAKLARILRKPVGSVLATLRGIPEKVQAFASFFEIEVEDLKAYTLWVESENSKLTEEFGRHEEERRRVEGRRAERAAIREVHAMLLQGASRDAVVARVLRAAREAAGSRRTVTALVQESPPQVKSAWADGDVTPEFLGKFRFPLSEEGVFAQVNRSGEAIHVLDAQMPYFARLLSARERRVLDAPSFTLLPLLQGLDPVGILYADRAKGDEPFSDEEVETLAALADLLSLALQR
ncbi:MAG: HDOD domain-containing protein [Deltaproteobacteria bacterium]|nr:HDOD domain-containing protein [Deltaproteobacteria bacterium]